MKVFDLKDASQFVSSMTVQVRGAMVLGLWQAAERTRTEVLGTIEGMDPKPVHMGLYRAAWMVQKTEDGAIISNSLPYAAVIEYGAQPGRIMPSKGLITALTFWVRKKLGVSEKDAPSVAWAVAKKLQAKGLQPRKVFEKVLPKIPALIELSCKAELDRIGAK